MKLIVQIIAGGKKWNLELIIEGLTDEEFLKKVEEKDGTYVRLLDKMYSIQKDEQGLHLIEVNPILIQYGYEEFLTEDSWCERCGKEKNFLYFRSYGGEYPQEGDTFCEECALALINRQEEEAKHYDDCFDKPAP